MAVKIGYDGTDWRKTKRKYNGPPIPPFRTRKGQSWELQAPLDELLASDLGCSVTAFASCACSARPDRCRLWPTNTEVFLNAWHVIHLGAPPDVSDILIRHLPERHWQPRLGIAGHQRLMGILDSLGYSEGTPHPVAQLAADIRDITCIWMHCLYPSGAGFPDISWTDTSRHPGIAALGEALGMKAMLQAYAGGVPLPDIIGYENERRYRSAVTSEISRLLSENDRELGYPTKNLVAF